MRETRESHATPPWDGGTPASWIELSRGAACRNVALFRRLADRAGARLGVVVKANAYGHGLYEMLALIHEQVDVLHVVTPADALALRAWEAAQQRPRRDVLVIGAVSPADVVALARERVAVVLYDGGWPDWADALRVAGVGPAQVHIHIDSGLGREGLRPEQVADVLAGVRDVADAVEVCACLTHFANTEDVTEQAYARSQLAHFNTGVEAVAHVTGRRDLARHAAASAAVLNLPEARLDVLRVGIGLYGLWPSPETRLSARLLHDPPPELAPVLSWRCVSQLTKVLPAGAFVGYGCTWRCRRSTRIAVLPVGYFDGYPRLASGRAHVLVQGQRCAVLGRVMMNHLVIDITDLPTPERQVIATLVGRDGDECVSLDDLAGWSQTIGYEASTRVGGHLLRRIVP